MMPMLTRVPAVSALIARCPICQQTNNAIVARGVPEFTPSHCEHAVSVSMVPPEMSFSETGE